MNMTVTADTVLTEGSSLLALGREEDLKKLMKLG